MMISQLCLLDQVQTVIILSAVVFGCCEDTIDRGSEYLRKGAAVTRGHGNPSPRGGNQSYDLVTDRRQDTSHACHRMRGTAVVPCSPDPLKPFPRILEDLFDYAMPLDRFHCGGCICFNVSRKVTLVDCNYKHTYMSLDTIPGWLPPESQSLDLSHNRITQLISQNLFLYTTAFALNISTNRLRSINGTFAGISKVQSPLTVLDISWNPVETITDGVFHHFPNLTHLFAARLQFPQVTNFTFAGLSKLDVLDLSYGTIHHIEAGAFQSLESLTVLLLTHNRRLSYSKMTPDLFRPLRQLSILDIAGASGSDNVPSLSLSVLLNLKELYVDGIRNLEFGPEVKNLSLLSTLYIGKNGFCSVESITVEMFENLVSLKKLFLYECKLNPVHPVSLGSLQDLEEFTIHKLRSHMTIYQGLAIIPFLNKTKLKSLVFQHFHYLGGYRMTAIGYNESHLFQGLSRLEILKIESQNIYFVEPRFVERLPPSLKYLSFKDNRLHRVNLVRDVLSKGKLPGLLEFDLSEQNYDSSFDLHRVNRSKWNATQAITTDNQYFCSLRMWLLTQKLSHMITQLESRIPRVGYSNRPKNLTQSSPHYLSRFRANNAFRFGEQVLDPSSSFLVKEVYFSNAYLNSWSKLRLPSSVVVADLSDNKCDKLTTGFLSEQNHMEFLNLRRNYLGNVLAWDKDGETFARAYVTTYLDLSHNSIYQLPYKVFQNMSKVRVIVLTDNHLQVLDLKLFHMTSLKFLDLRRNSLSWISRRSCDHLDTIAMSHGVTLALEDTPLPCTCNGLELLRWIAFTQVRILDRDFLLCRNEDNQIHPLGDSEARFREMRRTCVSHAYILAVSISLVGVAVVIIVCGLLVRYRWRLCYWKNIFLARYYGMRQRDGNNTQYKFDAYLVHSEDIHDFVITECFRELEDRGHKVCIEDKDFLPGSFIPCNIVSAVQSSTFTVLILSPGYRDNDWFEYALQMALMEEATSHRQVLHLILYQPMQDAQLSRDLHKLMWQDTYSEFPPPDCQPEVKKVFWDTFSRLIGHTSNPEQHPRLELEI